jgi:hypothetical protein
MSDSGAQPRPRPLAPIIRKRGVRQIRPPEPGTTTPK